MNATVTARGSHTKLDFSPRQAIQKLLNALNRAKFGPGFRPKKHLFLVAESVDFFHGKLTQKMAEDVFLLSAIEDEREIFFLDFLSHRVQKSPPCLLVDRMTVDNHAIHIKNSSLKHGVPQAGKDRTPGQVSWASW